MIRTVLVFSLCLFSAPLSAQTVLSGDHSIQGNGCIGGNCGSSETFSANDALKLNGNTVSLLFEDVSGGGSFPDNDWRLLVNDGNSYASGGINRFSVEDVDFGTIPFTIEPGAPENAFWLANNGFIGFGTSLPQQNLHILDTSGSAILRMEENDEITGLWDFVASNLHFYIRQNSNGITQSPFFIEGGAPTFSVFMEDDGDIGLGTSQPEGKLHMRGFGVQLAYMESSNGDPVQMRFRTNSENRRFLAVNNANEVKTQIIFKDNEILFTGQTDSGANRWLTIGPSGIISRGPTCNPGPCDATFDPEQFEVPPLKERTAYMWENQHLWAVGPTKPGEPINLTEKTGAMLHELEVAYIYIEQLHDRLEAQDELNAQLLSRLEALEAK